MRIEGQKQSRALEGDFLLQHQQKPAAGDYTSHNAKCVHGEETRGYKYEGTQGSRHQLTFLKIFPFGWISSSSFKISRVPNSLLSLNLFFAYRKTLSSVLQPGYKTEAKLSKLSIDLYAESGSELTDFALIWFDFSCLDSHKK